MDVRADVLEYLAANVGTEISYEKVNSFHMRHFHGEWNTTT